MKKTLQLLFATLIFMSINSFANSQKIDLPHFKTLTTEEVQQKIAQGVAVIDIRRVDEWNAFGVIPSAKKLTFFDRNGKYDAKLWLEKLKTIIKDENTPFILVCAHANRSKAVGKFLNDKTNYKHIYELSGGINYGWIDKGLATTKIPAKEVKNPWYKFW